MLEKMNFGQLLVIVLFSASIGATLGLGIAVNKNVKAIDAKINAYLEATTRSGEVMLEVVKRTRAFEATGFEADVTDDGRIKIVFLRKVASKEEDGSKKDMAEFREIVVPAWMFTQITSEAALKLGFEALENKATKDDTPSSK